MQYDYYVTMEMQQLIVTQQYLSRYYGTATNSLLCNSNHHVTIVTLPKT
jgi:hypothetical protein